MQPSVLVIIFWAIIFLCNPISVCLSPLGDKVSMLTHTYPHKARRKIEVIICKITRLTAHFMCGLMSGPDVWSADLHLLIKSMVIHDTECPYWDQVSLNNTNLGNLSVCMMSVWLCYFVLACTHISCKGKGKGSCLESRLHDNAYSTGFTLPLARWSPMQPATINPILDLCTRYPLHLGGLRQCRIWSLPNASTYGQHWESNLRPCDLESNALSTGPHVYNMNMCNVLNNQK